MKARSVGRMACSARFRGIAYNNQNGFRPSCLWEETGGARIDFPHLIGTTRADVAVIGGGFTGLSAAIHAADAGAQVLVLEQNRIGFGASGRCGGQVIPGLKYDPSALIRIFGPELGSRVVAFAGSTADIVCDLIAEHRIDCDLVRNGWIQAATSSRGAIDAERRAREWGDLGAPVETLDRDSAAALTGVRGYIGGWIDRRGGHLHPFRYVQGLAAAATRRGAKIYESSPAVRVEKVGGRWRVETRSGEAFCDRVIIGTNGYTGDLWPRLSGTVATVNSLQMATAPLPPEFAGTILPSNCAVSEIRHRTYYYRLDHDGRLVIGGRGAYADPKSFDAFGHLRDALYRLFPHVAGVPIRHHWYSRFANTRDHLPHLHELAPGVLAWLGCNGRGIALATAIGRELAHCSVAVTGKRPTLPVTNPRTIPLHWLEPFYVSAMSRYYGIVDWLS